MTEALSFQNSQNSTKSLIFIPCMLYFKNNYHRIIGRQLNISYLYRRHCGHLYGRLSQNLFSFAFYIALNQITADINLFLCESKQWQTLLVRNNTTDQRFDKKNLCSHFSI
jgi:hypothetical protein